MGARGSSGGMVGGCCENLKGGTALFSEAVNPLEAPFLLYNRCKGKRKIRKRNLRLGFSFFSLAGQLCFDLFRIRYEKLVFSGLTVDYFVLK